ncbi:MAG: hypothetical protein HY235_21270, partial [Acidobacteria bacterium]|nr:hypothetical protein [Acidobacteriota bacterium]
MSRIFTSAGKQCADCHADFHRRQFGSACQDCHTVRGWKVNAGSVRTHLNRFPLLGAHAAVECESCHRGAASGIYTGLSTECFSCHRANYERTRLPDHRAANLPLDCALCHSVDRWLGARFDHDRFTRFPLLGAHKTVSCSTCHAGGSFHGTAADCYSCHVRQFQSTTSPDHVKAGFPADCSICHNSTTWQGARFDHDTATRFQLTGAHTSAQCNSCHAAGRFAGTPNACSGCHMTQFESVTNPDHKRGNFSTQCEACHGTARWQGARFDHNLSRFPLTGSHVRVDCFQCHIGGKYTGTVTDCYDCHRTSFDQTATHIAGRFPTNCTLCHTTAQWQGARFDHSAATRFPLTGAHIAAGCTQCHTGNRFAGTASDCASCHVADFQKAAAPSHTAAGFSTECSSCHITQQWKGATFDHGVTRFALTGKHTSVSCGQCHTGNRFAGLGTACTTCHLPEFQRTTTPNHPAAGFPQDCTVCHTTTQWRGARFDHNSGTRFQLTGKHAAVQCAQCHVNNKFTGTATACNGCHLREFQQATNPNHAAAGFPQDCTVCHTTAQWKGARFDHNSG